MVVFSLFKKSAVIGLFFLCLNTYANSDIVVLEKYTKKQKERLYKRGEKIYKTLCTKIDISKYKNYEKLKLDILNNNFCGKQKEKNLEAISFYLWNSNKSNNLKPTSSQIVVPKGSKCPVCGMFVWKYPKWAAKMEIGEHIHYFDGVKDMMKFYYYPSSFGHEHNKSDIKNMYVSDYYTLNQIDAKKAFYVIGSNVYGPMGHEFIAFKEKKDAKVFMKNHYGKRVLSFKQINEELVFALDK